ncbi:MAG: type VI secretion system ImpA family N-terminal domain-containing protein [Holosporales bacterium]|jgi:type VI secretion system ImpA family protein|nr:type VI secretion system ImpA family N-terminal domain-containing protein [Holosporales bacterium]
MNRISYEIGDVLAEIQGSPDGVGYDVAFSKVYDEIKEARFEEDDSVSFGIWQRELKKADWALMERLAFKALAEKSKDLQILGWFVESLAAQDGFSGIARGIEALTGFVKLFWRKSYPKLEDGSSDEEQKFRILDWIYETLAKRSKLIPIVKHNGEEINLYNYDYAVELKNKVLKAPNSASQILEAAKKNGVKTIDDIQGILDAVEWSVFEETQGYIQKIEMRKEEFAEAVALASKEHSGGVFASLTGNLASIDKIISAIPQRKERLRREEVHLQKEIPSKEEIRTDVPKKIQIDRDGIYNQIASLAKELAVIEKHSPSSHILNLMVSWKDKNLFEIINDLKTGDSDAHRLLKFLV